MMKVLEEAIASAEGAARAIGEILREAARRSPKAAELIEQDLAVSEMSLDNCLSALHKHAQKHQKGGCWGCAVMGFDPENEVIGFVLEYYKIPVEWFAGEGGTPTLAAPPAAARAKPVDLMNLL